MPQQPYGPLRSFGRIKARPIKARQASLLESLMPRIALDLSQPIVLSALKPDAAETWLEIGFGGGEHLAAQAALRADVLMLGAEPFLNGIASALRHIDAASLSNVRLHAGDARDLLAALPSRSLERVFILFPDPWPKQRHHKRRLIQPPVVAELVRVMKPHGRLRFATDWADYADWTLDLLTREPKLVWTAQRANDWRCAPDDHVPTRYEAKKLGDIAPVYLEFQRSPEPSLLDPPSLDQTTCDGSSGQA
jgi:tRNA (guanine-N7-)-methyltransferase